MGQIQVAKNAIWSDSLWRCFPGKTGQSIRLVPGVLGITDDIVIHGAMENTDDWTVLILCVTARLNNLSLNSKKKKFKSTGCRFFGHRLTTDGIKVDPKKIEATIHIEPPWNVASLQSFNSMVNYLKKFSPVLSELSVHHITQSALVSKARPQELRLATQSDPTLCSLAKAVHEGWLQSKKDCLKQLLDGWTSLQEPKTDSATQ